MNKFIVLILLIYFTSLNAKDKIFHLVNDILIVPDELVFKSRIFDLKIEIAREKNEDRLGKIKIFTNKSEIDICKKYISNIYSVRLDKMEVNKSHTKNVFIITLPFSYFHRLNRKPIDSDFQIEDNILRIILKNDKLSKISVSIKSGIESFLIFEDKTTRNE